MTPNKLIQEISKGRIKHFYFLYGSERFYQTEIIQALKLKLITEDNHDFNLETFDAKASSVNQWLGAVKTISFLGGTKLVVVRDLHEVISKKQGSDEDTQSKKTNFIDNQDIQALIDYANTKLVDTCLVITADKVDRRVKLIKTLTEFDGASCCEAPQKEELWLWVKTLAKESGYSISKEAAESLVDHTGTRPGILAKELEKLLVFSGKNKTISRCDGNEVVGDTAVVEDFSLANALKEANLEKVMHLIRKEIDHGEAPERLVGGIAWQIRTIWEVKTHQSQGLPPNQIAKKMGANPGAVHIALKHTKKFSIKQLRKCHGELVLADRSLKSTSNRESVMEALALNLCTLLGAKPNRQ